jgi:DNA-binding NarL/FixJ family response regulator
LIADSHSLCRAGLVAMFVRDLNVAGIHEASDFPGMLAILAESPRIELLALDLNLAGMRGASDLRRLRTEYPRLAVVVVAATRDRELVLDALGAGVHGYVPKDLPAQEMANAFTSVIAGQIYVPALVSDISGTRRSEPQPISREHPPVLTARQYEVLCLLASGQSNKEIARALRIAEGTVKVHVTAAFRILGVHNRVGAAAALHQWPGSIVSANETEPPRKWETLARFGRETVAHFDPGRRAALAG